MSYNADIYHAQGADNVVVASGGEIDIESGGKIQIASGGSLEAPTASISTATTSTTIPAYGLTVVKTTKTVKSVTLDAPAGGERKVIYATNADDTGYFQVHSGTSNITFDGSNWILQFMKDDQSVILDALSTARWVLSYDSDTGSDTSINKTST